MGETSFFPALLILY